MIEAAQVGSGTWTCGAVVSSVVQDDERLRLRFTGGEGARLLDDRFGADQLLAAAVLDRLTHAVQRMIDQELQDSHEPPRAGSRPVVLLPARCGTR